MLCGMGYWWVNHKKTGKREIQGGFLWAPKRDRGGNPQRGYDNMEVAQPGDVVFSLINAKLGHVGVVQALAETAPKPEEFGKAGDDWAREGWKLPVTFQPVPQPVRPKAYLAQLKPYLPTQYSPLNKAGGGSQNMYLAEISDELGKVLLDMMGLAGQLASATTSDALSTQALADIQQVKADRKLPSTTRDQLIKARLGQGLFRSRVLKLHPVCKVTGIADPRLLRASHIKPWRECNNDERLDGANGIMLSPHIDALFDQGLISFGNDGRMLVRADLSSQVLSRWSIPEDLTVSPFPESQWDYLAWHRQQWAATQAKR